MLFGEVIRQLRKERGLSQKDLAQLLKIDQSRIPVWEKGAVIPSGVNLLKITRALGVSLAVFDDCCMETPVEQYRINKDQGSHDLRR